MQVDGVSLVTPEAGNVAASAAALFLLRTLEQDHTRSDRVGERLFPCCGHGMFDMGGEDVVMIGCPYGSDLFVRHLEGSQLELESMEGRRFLVDKVDWWRAVIRFSDLVTAFYEESLPKTPYDPVEAKGFQKMLAEWRRRRRAAEGS